MKFALQANLEVPNNGEEQCEQHHGDNKGPLTRRKYDGKLILPSYMTWPNETVYSVSNVGVMLLVGR